MLVVFSVGLGFDGHAVAAEEERILDFKSHVQVLRDGSVTITEEIKVVAAGDKIKRGIFRDFPTQYQDRYGNTIRVGFNVVSVLRDGISDSYHIEERSNGKRVYIGRKDFFLQPGTYTYTITYKTDHQLGYFKDFDELYWNVTGNGWDFVIEGAEALVELPPGTEVLKTAAYTGYSGEKGHDFTTRVDEEGMIQIQHYPPPSTERRFHGCGRLAQRGRSRAEDQGKSRFYFKRKFKHKSSAYWLHPAGWLLLYRLVPGRTRPREGNHYPAFFSAQRIFPGSGSLCFSDGI